MVSARTQKIASATGVSPEFCISSCRMDNQCLNPNFVHFAFSIGASDKENEQQPSLLRALGNAWHIRIKLRMCILWRTTVRECSLQPDSAALGICFML